MKSTIHKLKVLSGRAIYYVGFPILFAMLHKSTRARAIIVQKDRILLVKSWVGSGKWELPGGGVGIDDKPDSAVVREVKEELGIDLDKKSLKELEPQLNTDIFKIKSHYFLIKISTDEELVIDLGKELVEYKWFKLNRLKNLRLHANARDVLSAQNMLE